MTTPHEEHLGEAGLRTSPQAMPTACPEPVDGAGPGRRSEPDEECGHLAGATSRDSTAALLREGYRYVSARCDALGTDVFLTRLMLRPTICMRGPVAARIFYDTARIMRQGAAPGRMRRTLTGSTGAQNLDGEEHLHRKAMLLSIMTPQRVAALSAQFEQLWTAALADWASRPGVVLLDEVGRLLCRAVYAWAGVPLAEPDVPRRTRELEALITGGAAIGPRHWRAIAARRSAERRLAGVVTQVRDGALRPPAGSALRIIAEHRGLDGAPLDARVAAVELLNVLRPTVAVDRFVTFAALALHEHPEWARRLAAGDDDLLPFVHEVRRFYPFFPFAAGRVRETFTVGRACFPRGVRVLFDLYGTDHDPRSWPDPHAFRPERFSSGSAGNGLGDGLGNPYTFVPQGGGNPATGHRCAGEQATIDLMATAVRCLTRGMSYRVPPQDLSIDLGRIPARPASGFVIDRVERRA